MPARPRSAHIRKKKEKLLLSPPVLEEQQVTEDEMDGPTGEALALTTAVTTVTPNTHVTSQLKTEESHHRKRNMKRPKGISTPLMSDARTEHLLLAARKIGRERMANIVGLKESQARELEEERKRQFESWIGTPKTPRLPPSHSHPNFSHLQSHAITHNQEQPHAPHTPNAFVFLNSSMGLPPSFPGSPMRPHYLAPPPGHPAFQKTPTRQKSVGRVTEHTGPAETSPQTPLDSLLSAARSMMDDGPHPRANGVGIGSTQTSGNLRRANVLDMPESPVPPKRRKIAGGSTTAGLVRRAHPEAQVSAVAGPSSGSVGDADAKVGRVKSALDVLADQAVVFSSSERGRKGREKKANGRSESVEPETPSLTTRTRKSSRKDRQQVGKGDDKDKGRDIVAEPEDGTTLEPQMTSQGNGAETEGAVLLPVSHDRLAVARASLRQDNYPSPQCAEAASQNMKPMGKQAEREQDGPPPITEGARGHDPRCAGMDESADAVSGTLVEEKDKDDQGSLSTQEISSLTSYRTTTVQSRIPTSPVSHTLVHGNEANLQAQDSGSIAPLHPTTLERSRSEDGREHKSVDLEPRRAASIPLLTTRHDTDSDLDLEDRSFRMESETQTEMPRTAYLHPDTSDLGPKILPIHGDVGETAEASNTNQNVTKVGGQEIQLVMAGKRPRSPYVKWSKEEDDLLAQVGCLMVYVTS
jgi:hypothetical protein